MRGYPFPQQSSNLTDGSPDTDQHCILSDWRGTQRWNEEKILFEAKIFGSPRCHSGTLDESPASTYIWSRTGRSNTKALPRSLNEQLDEFMPTSSLSSRHGRGVHFLTTPTTIQPIRQFPP